MFDRCSLLSAAHDYMKTLLYGPEDILIINTLPFLRIEIIYKMNKRVNTLVYKDYTNGHTKADEVSTLHKELWATEGSWEQDRWNTPSIGPAPNSLP